MPAFRWKVRIHSRVSASHVVQTLTSDTPMPYRAAQLRKRHAATDAVLIPPSPDRSPDLVISHLKVSRERLEERGKSGEGRLIQSRMAKW
jgi:hypothetical protein